MKAKYRLAGACLSTALLAACGSGSLSSSTPASVAPQLGQSLHAQPAPNGRTKRRVKRASETLTYLHSFGGGSDDGSYPMGPLVSVNGTLYGTTEFGGTGGYNGQCGPGCGTVFSVTPSGTYALLYSFANEPDGAIPYAGLSSLSGKLYGTTRYGGAYDQGTVYSITTSGTEGVLQSFYSGSDGTNPIATLINVSGTLYGTTDSGGTYNSGTVFAIKPSGAETVLHNFGGTGDGQYPNGPMLLIGNTFYGTTTRGGANGDGTVFEVAKSNGREQVLYSFAGGPDGRFPAFGRLIDVGGTLYGTTNSGGAYGNQGTIYSVTRSGTETVLHSFAGGSDGSYPAGGLSNVSGTFYGTTGGGGVYSQGTIYSMTPSASGSYTVIWAFGGSPGGANPQADMIDVGGTLYGTTNSGGVYNQGTIFSLLPNN